MGLVIVSNVRARGLPFLEKDGLLYGAKDANQLFDVARPDCFPRQGASSNGESVMNLSRLGSAGRIAAASGVVLGFSGRGIDLEGVTTVPAGVVLPGNPLATLNQEQNFLICGYFKIPTIAQWVTGSGASQAIVGDATVVGNANNQKQLMRIELVSVGSDANRARIWFRRQTALGQVFNDLTFDAADIPHGEVAQLAMWRTADGAFAQIRSASKRAMRSRTRGANNSVDLTDCQPLFGRTGVTSVQASHHRVYRGFFEDLGASGRDPISVLEDDWARVTRQNLYS